MRIFLSAILFFLPVFVLPPAALAQSSALETVVPATTENTASDEKRSRYAISGGPSQLTLGQMIAYRIHDPDLSEFKAAMAASVIETPPDLREGYTVFAPINGEFDPEDKPMSYYILKEALSLATFPAAYDTRENLLGEDIAINKAGTRSYFIDDMRVNAVERHPEGMLYKVGGWQDAPHL